MGKGHGVKACLGNGVVPAGGQGTAPQDPPDRQCKACKKASFFKGLQCVGGAGGRKTAGGVGLATGQMPLIESYQRHTEPLHGAGGVLAA